MPRTGKLPLSDFFQDLNIAIDIRYADKGTYCLCSLPKGRTYAETYAEEKSVRKEKGKFWAVFFGAFSGGLAGSLIAGLLAAFLL